MGRFARGVLALLLLTSIGKSAQAEDFEYRYLPEWRRFGVADYAATAGIAATYLVLEFTTKTPRIARWTTPLPLDRQTRELLVAPTRSGRERLGPIADVVWYSLVGYSVADAGIVPLVRGWNFDASWQLTMMTAQSYAVASLLVRVPHKLVGRARPLVEGCRTDSAYSAQCGSPAQFVSFPGGHLAISATAAGLVCAHHLFGGLYGSVTADTIPCATALVATSVVGVMRVQSDKHWVSDQLSGAAIGFGAGFLLPGLVYYRSTPRRTVRRGVTPRPAKGSLQVLPLISAETLGLRLIVNAASL